MRKDEASLQVEGILGNKQCAKHYAANPRAGMRMVDAEYKLEKNIKIAMLYLEDDDAVNAETFIKKAASLITGTKVLPNFFPADMPTLHLNW